MKRYFRQLLTITVLLLFGVASLAFAADPKIDALVPADNAINVPVNQVISITFNNTMKWSSIYKSKDNEYRMYLRKASGSTLIACAYSPTSDAKVYTLTPSANLLPNTKYEIVFLADKIKDDDDKKLKEYYDTDWLVYDFTTAAVVGGDTTPPIVEATYPATGDTAIPIAVKIEVTFSEDIALADVNSSFFEVRSGSTSGTLVGMSSYSYDSASNTVSLTPTSNLANSTTYYVKVKKDIHDLASPANHLANDYNFSFTTAATVDSTPPTVTSKTPGSGATGVAVTAPINITFSENMDATTLTSATITVSGGVTPAANKIDYNTTLRMATFTPSSNLSHSTSYTVTVTTGVKDVAGNAMVANHSWVFTTVAGTVSPSSPNDYCQVPPFASSSSGVQPNVLIIFDNSGSMSSLAYGSSSYVSTASYAGYFEKNKMYKYNYTSGWFEVDTNTAHNAATNWTGGSTSGSGNFLNWLTMRRVDVIRDVLVGGKHNARTGQTAYYKIPYAGGSSTLTYNNTYYQIGNQSGIPSIKICSSSSCKAYTAPTSGTYYKSYVYVGTNPVDGLVQKMSDRIRFGLMLFNEDGSKYENEDTGVKDGGYIASAIGNTTASNVNDVDNIAYIIEGRSTTKPTNPSTWTPLAESLYEAVRYFQHTNSAYNGIDYATSADPIIARCQKNFVMILTDGASTKDQNIPGSAFSTTITKVTDAYSFNAETWLASINTNTTANNAVIGQNTITNSLDSDGSKYLPAVAYYAHNTDLRSSTVGNGTLSGIQNLTVYTVFAFDNSTVSEGKNLLKMASLYGAYTDSNTNGKPDLQSEYDIYNNLTGVKTPDTIPDTFFDAKDGDILQSSLRRAFDDIVARVTSGTAASILNNSEGSGANLMQAMFYPKKSFEAGTELVWSGEIHNMWYYLEPYLQATSIREDTTKDFILNLKQDRIAQFNFDAATSTTAVKLFADSNGNGFADTPSTPDASLAPDAIASIWKAGQMLWERDPTTRTIYTHTGISGRDDATSKFTLFKKGDGGSSSLEADTTFNGLIQAANVDEATIILDYINGSDKGASYRSREVEKAGCGITSTVGLTDTSKPCRRVWKLGDIISSTPKLASTNQLGSYSLAPPSGYNDSSYKAFLESTVYKTRGMVFVGANDGMLHAFKLGILKEINDPFSKAKLTTYNSAGTDDATKFPTATSSSELGYEEWAFIPKQTLPYLKYLAATNYSHIYYVDKSPTLIDASIGGNCTSYDPSGLLIAGGDYSYCTKDSSTWRTILIGASGYGGAAKATSNACTAPANCVKTPIAGTGYSGFFALDVTDPAVPKYLWEFYGNNNGSTTETGNIGELGFALSGPATIRISAKTKTTTNLDTLVPDHTKNGKWFAVFASGSTGPIDTVNQEFKGQSDQYMKLFVVDLASGKLVKTINTGIADAFGGSITTGSAVDTESNAASANGFYSDNVLYVGYVKKDTATGLWTKGGVGRLVTHESTDPNTWTWSTVIDNTGPVTTAVTRTVDRKNKTMWLYFGTGRYYYKLDDDSTTARQALYGLKEPCYSSADRAERTPYTNLSGGSTMLSASGPFDGACSDSVSGTIVDQSGTASSAPAATISKTAPGWKINLDLSVAENLSADPQIEGLLSERVITDPVASASGAVFFTTFRPSSNACKSGGDALIWAVRYDSGGEPPAAAMQGKILLQSSTGAFSEVTLATAFDQTDQRYDGRRIATAIAGVPPTGQGLLLMTNPRPIKKMLQIMEK